MKFIAVHVYFAESSGVSTVVEYDDGDRKSVSVAGIPEGVSVDESALAGLIEGARKAKAVEALAEAGVDRSAAAAFLDVEVAKAKVKAEAEAVKV